MKLWTPPATAQSGVQGGYAPLDSGLLVPVAYMPKEVPRRIKIDGTASTTLTGTTNETIMGFVNVPAGMGADGALEVDHLWGAGGGAGNWVLHIRIIAGTVPGTLAGTRLVNSTVGATTNLAFRGNHCVVNLHATNAQTCLPTSSSYVQTSASFVAGAIDTTAAWTISLNAALVNAGDNVTLKHLRAMMHVSS